MLSLIIQYTIISIILVFLVHHIIHFLKSTLTVPKIKDLVNIPKEKYKNIYNVIESKNKKLDDHYMINELLPKNDNLNMKDELKNFLKNQLHN
jgi:hypothetical protein